MAISDKDLYEELRVERDKIAIEVGESSAFVIAPIRTLEELAVFRPNSLTEMLDIWGIADIRLEKYGQQFLDILIKHRTK